MQTANMPGLHSVCSLAGKPGIVKKIKSSSLLVITEFRDILKHLLAHEFQSL